MSMRGKTVRAAGILGLGVLLMATPVGPAAASEDPPVYQPSADTRSTCEVDTWVSNTHRVNASLHCTVIPVGVQVRLVIDIPSAGDEHSEWVGSRNSGQLVEARTNNANVSVRLEESVDPDLPGTDCTSQIVKKDRFLQYDAHAVEVTCTAIAAGIKVRGRADFQLQPDEVSAWITAPGSAVSDYKVRMAPHTPVDVLEYAVR